MIPFITRPAPGPFAKVTISWKRIRSSLVRAQSKADERTGI